MNVIEKGDPDIAKAIAELKIKFSGLTSSSKLVLSVVLKLSFHHRCLVIAFYKG